MARRHGSSCTVAFVLITALLTSSCVRETARQYELSGQILQVRRDTNEVLIKHGDIKGFMPGMTMPFKVRDASLLETKAAGDLVTATLMVHEADVWIATLQKTGSAPLPEDATPATSRPHILQSGDPAPTAVLIDDDNRPLTLEAWRGSAVAITFIYTRCPLPQYCPLMDRRFADLQRVIKGDAALQGRARLVSVSFDPDTDRPDILRAHARKLDADPTIWRFASAPATSVDQFAASFGVAVMREADRTITHNLRTAVIGPDGKIVSVYSGSEWTVEQVAADLRRSLETT